MSTTSPLAPRDLLILATLAEGPNHGYGLITRVKERSDAKVTLDPANLYRVLRRMRRLEWIAEDSQSESQASGVGKRRRTYRITSQGTALLNGEVERLELLLQQTKPALAEGSD